MSRRREVEASLRAFGEIRDVLNAMENMARLEVHRLSRFLLTQQRVVSSIEALGSDFVAFYPELFSANQPWREVHLLLGSARGFCADFNEALVRAYEKHARGEAPVVMVGSKLTGKLPRGVRTDAVLDGASVVEEVEDVLMHLINALSDREEPHSARQPLRVTVFHHQSQNDDEVRVSILQPFRGPGTTCNQFAYPPRLYLEPVVFANGLVEQYLFARLHELLYTSLMVENQIRVQHLNAAVQRLETKSAELLRRRNILRQEEITEEIEVIMLSAGAQP